MNRETLVQAIEAVSRIMQENCDYLVELDARNGDGDLGISMSSGYSAVAAFLRETEETDLGKLLMKSAMVFNETAPSSLGTITSFGFMGMARKLKGSEEVTLPGLAEAMEAGLENMMQKAKSGPGEKTILDALVPAVEALKQGAGADAHTAWEQAFRAAEAGSEATRNMKAVHGRAAYYGDGSLGLVDGGSVVGKLIFDALRQVF